LRLDEQVWALLLALVTVAGVVAAVLPSAWSRGGYTIALEQNATGTRIAVYVGNGYSTPALLAVRGWVDGRPVYSTTILLPPGSHTSVWLGVGGLRGWLVLKLYVYDASRGAWLFTGRWLRLRLGVGGWKP